MIRRSSGRPRVAVVGGGVAGLAAAQAALESAPDLELALFERSPRLGGLVETEQVEGFVIEHGADCLMTSKPGGLEAIERAGLMQRTVSTCGTAQGTFVVRSGRLVKMPAGLAFGAPASALELAGSDLLSLSAKLRLALEPWQARRVSSEDESVASFVRRRFGDEFLQFVVAPVLEGVHGADADQLSMQACLPQLRECEQRVGSVARAMRARSHGKAPPVLSLRDGMESLVAAMARTVAPHAFTSSAVHAITRTREGAYRLRLERGSYEADALIVAAPAYAAAPLVSELSTTLTDLLAAVRYSRLDCVTLAFERAAFPALEASGFVVPRSEARALRACTWSSLKWPGRAPDGYVLTRSMLRGEGRSDEELVEAARQEYAELLDVRAAPKLVRVRRRTACLPVPELGCLDRREQMLREAQSLGAFALAGNALGLVGLPDCISSGRAAGLRITRELAERAYLHAS